MGVALAEQLHERRVLFFRVRPEGRELETASHRVPLILGRSVLFEQLGYSEPAAKAEENHTERRDEAAGRGRPQDDHDRPQCDDDRPDHHHCGQMLQQESAETVHWSGWIYCLANVLA